MIIYKKIDGLSGLPPEAFPGAGSPVVPKELCCAVIDTKNSFGDVKDYALQPVFNLMNDATLTQLDFLGNTISKCVFACMTTGDPESLEKNGNEYGLNIFVLGKYQSSPVSDAEKRSLHWTLANSKISPLQRFRKEIESAAQNWLANSRNV
ncbi:MAG: hypothetical protein WCH01_20335 [Methylococcaceae bacterium]